MESVFTSNILLLGFLILALSFLFVYFVIPKIIWINHYKKLMDDPDGRSSHKISTPTMAGFAFFLGIVILVFFLKSWDADKISLNYIASMVVIFAIGIKDDLANSTPKAKIFGEVVAILFILSCECLSFPSFEGFLGIYKIPLAVSYFINIILILTIINSYNLIDGIDGLAASIGITIFSIYTLIFYVIGLYFYFFLSVSLIGVLLAYLRYNISKSDKIFMGDTGSLIIGFSIGLLTLKFLSIDTLQFENFKFLPENRIIVVIAILCIPLFDTFRVFFIRILNKKNPFAPDRNHVHHVLIDYGFSHYNASIVLAIINYLVVLFLVFMSSIYNSIIMVLILIFVYVGYILLFYKLKQKLKHDFIEKTEKSKKINI